MSSTDKTQRVIVLQNFGYNQYNFILYENICIHNIKWINKINNLLKHCQKTIVVFKNMGKKQFVGNKVLYEFLMLQGYCQIASDAQKLVELDCVQYEKVSKILKYRYLKVEDYCFFQIKNFNNEVTNKEIILNSKELNELKDGQQLLNIFKGNDNKNTEEIIAQQITSKPEITSLNLKIQEQPKEDVKVTENSTPDKQVIEEKKVKKNNELLTEISENEPNKQLFDEMLKDSTDLKEKVEQDSFDSDSEDNNQNASSQQGSRKENNKNSKKRSQKRSRSRSRSKRSKSKTSSRKHISYNSCYPQRSFHSKQSHSKDNYSSKDKQSSKDKYSTHNRKNFQKKDRQSSFSRKRDSSKQRSGYKQEKRSSQHQNRRRKNSYTSIFSQSDRKNQSFRCESSRFSHKSITMNNSSFMRFDNESRNRSRSREKFSDRKSSGKKYNSSRSYKKRSTPQKFRGKSYGNKSRYTNYRKRYYPSQKFNKTKHFKPRWNNNSLELNYPNFENERYFSRNKLEDWSDSVEAKPRKELKTPNKIDNENDQNPDERQQILAPLDDSFDENESCCSPKVQNNNKCEENNNQKAVGNVKIENSSKKLSEIEEEVDSFDDDESELKDEIPIENVIEDKE